MQALATYSQATDHSVVTNGFSSALLRLRRVARPGSLIFIISDFAGFDANARQQLDRLTQHNEIIACLIRDPLEIEPPPSAIYPVTDGEQVMLLDCQTNEHRQAYQQYFAEQYAQLKSILLRRLTPLIELTTEQDPAMELARIFHRDAKRSVA